MSGPVPPDAPRPQGGPQPPPLPPAAPPPADVAAAAAAQHLGAHLGTRSWGRPRDAWLLVLVPVGIWAVLVVIAAVGVHFIFPFAALLLLWVASWLGRAIALTRRGEETSYLFAGGIVRSGKGGLLVAPWARAARLGKSDRNRGLTGGRRFPLHLVDGGVIEIPLRQEGGGGDAYLRNVAALMRQNGRPVD